jgi:hypothetical protein
MGTLLREWTNFSSIRHPLQVIVDQALGSRLLTTQLYFPNEPANLSDGLFQRELLMRVAEADEVRVDRRIRLQCGF